MNFFSAGVSRDGNRLSFHMNPFLRGGIIFAFASVLAMFLTVFTAEAYRDAPMFGKINTIIIPLILFIGTIYRYSIVFDKRTRTIEIQRGLVFLFSRERYSFEEFRGVKKTEPFRAHNLEVFRYRASFGLYVGSKLYLLERSIPVDRVQSLYNILLSYYPGNVPIVE